MAPLHPPPLRWPADLRPDTGLPPVGGGLGPGGGPVAEGLLVHVDPARVREGAGGVRTGGHQTLGPDPRAPGREKGLKIGLCRLWGEGTETNFLETRFESLAVPNVLLPGGNSWSSITSSDPS